MDLKGEDERQWLDIEGNLSNSTWIDNRVMVQGTTCGSLHSKLNMLGPQVLFSFTGKQHEEVDKSKIVTTSLQYGR